MNGTQSDKAAAAEAPRVSAGTAHFRGRVFHERRRAGLPAYFIDEMYPFDDAAGVPEHLRPIHRNLHTSGFPYSQKLDYAETFETRARPVVRIEDAGAAVTVLPWLGGRVAEFFDKRLNRELLWSPPAHHFATLGLSGAWTLGGMEFNAFRYGHNVHGTSSPEVRKVCLADGREGVELGAFDETFSCEWRVILTLVDGKLVQRIRIKNHSQREQPCLYWWSTLAVPLNRRDGIMLAPGEFLHHSMFRQGYEAHRWPMVHDTDWSRWLNQHEVVSGYLPHSASDFMGYVNEREGWSFFHRAPRDVCQGRKLWSLGCLNAHQVWWETLAEPSWSPYCELQCGLMPVQPTAGDFPGGSEIAWTECLGATSGAPGRSDYGEAFGAFQSKAESSIGRSWDGWNDPDFWRIGQATELFAAEPRLDISKKVATGEPVGRDEIETVVAHGWVAGEGWLRILRERFDELSHHGRLAYAGALLENREAAPAARELETLAASSDAPPEVRDWAQFFLGLIAEKETRIEDARNHFANCRFDHNSATALVAGIDQALARIGDREAREKLWRDAPVTAKTTDDFRLAQAWIAHAGDDWKTTRSHLEKPLLGIAEGASTAWLLWKESHFLEFAECCERGAWDEALRALAAGAKMAPQFGIGRQEDRQNADFLFYRYHLCKRLGWAPMARAFAEMILREPEYPGSMEALYVLRVALEEDDPTAPGRRQAIEQWNDQARPSWRERLPLRAALCGMLLEDNPQAWNRLLADPLYRQRAQFELSPPF